MDTRHREYMEARCKILLHSAKDILIRFNTAMRRKEMLIAAKYLRMLNQKMAQVSPFDLLGYIPEIARWRYEKMEGVIKENHHLLEDR